MKNDELYWDIHYYTLDNPGVMVAKLWQHINRGERILAVKLIRTCTKCDYKTANAYYGRLRAA